MAYQTIPVLTDTDIWTIDGNAFGASDIYDATTNVDGFKVSNPSGRVIVLLRNEDNEDTTENEVRLYDGGLIDSNVGANPGTYKRITGISSKVTFVGPLNPAQFNDADNNVRFSQVDTTTEIQVLAFRLMEV